jgi:hypothetical protein
MAKKPMPFTKAADAKQDAAMMKKEEKKMTSKMKSMKDKKK